MLKLLLATLFVLPTFAQEPGETPDPQEVERAVAHIEAAFKQKEASVKVAALKAGAELRDEKVVKAVARGFKDRDTEVVVAAFEALRSNRHAAAIDELEKYYKKNQKKLKKDETLLPPLLKAIGQHGRESSIEILTEDPFGVRKHSAIQARIYGLGNIRSEESVGALIDMLKKIGPNKIEDYMGDLRLAMYRLTGEDQGPNVQLWGDWWRDVHKGFKLPAEEPVLNEAQQGQWDAYWGVKEAPKEAPEAGGDGER